MPVRIPKAGTDINAWSLSLADILRVIGQENIIVEADGNNPPTIKAGSKFLVYKEHSYLIPDTLPTGNNVYPADTAVTTPISEAIFLSADVAFAWSTGGIPAKSNSTQYFIVCSGGEDVDETSQGKGVFDVQTLAETGGVTFDELKGGWYTASGDRAIAKFYVDGSGDVGSITSIDTDYWHYIGDSGEPAFGTYCANFDVSNFGKLAFRKIGNMVHVYGMITVGVPAVMLTFPSTHRPKYIHKFSLHLDSASDYTFNIALNGELSNETDLGATAGVFANFSFPIDKN